MKDLEKYQEANKKPNLSAFNKAKQPIILGCNYHTTWQSNKGMRFVLVDVIGDRARLKTRGTGKDFYTELKDIRFITTDYNIKKATTLRPRVANIFITKHFNL